MNIVQAIHSEIYKHNMTPSSPARLNLTSPRAAEGLKGAAGGQAPPSGVNFNPVRRFPLQPVAAYKHRQTALSEAAPGPPPSDSDVNWRSWPSADWLVRYKGTDRSQLRATTPAQVAS